LEQYNDLLRAIPGINAALKKAGHQVSDLDAAATSSAVSEKLAAKGKSKPKKSNIEQTSDEDEE
jgi:hypothetical protein